MRQRNGPLPAFAELHVQSTSIERPAPFATTLPLAVLTVIGVLLSDLALAALDPRIRLGGGATK